MIPQISSKVSYKVFFDVFVSLFYIFRFLFNIQRRKVFFQSSSQYKYFKYMIERQYFFLTFHILLHWKMCWVIKLDLEASKVFKLQYFDIITSQNFRQVLKLGYVLLAIKYEEKIRELEKQKRVTYFIYLTVLNSNLDIQLNISSKFKNWLS